MRLALDPIKAPSTLTLADVAQQLRYISGELVPRGTLDTWRSRSQFPDPDGMIGRHGWWHRATIAAWVDRINGLADDAGVRS